MYFFFPLHPYSSATVVIFFYPSTPSIPNSNVSNPLPSLPHPLVFSQPTLLLSLHQLVSSALTFYLFFSQAIPFYNHLQPPPDMAFTFFFALFTLTSSSTPIPHPSVVFCVVHGLLIVLLSWNAAVTLFRPATGKLLTKSSVQRNHKRFLKGC